MTVTSQLSYPGRPIGRLAVLAVALDVSLPKLQRIAAIASSQYRKAKPIVKSDGKTRQPYDAYPALKDIQRRIKSRLLERVQFPPYLTGSLKGRDARANAALHIGANITICEDIEKFFPSTRASIINTIWRGFFRFAPAVAELLTALTTKDGALPEGAVTSSHLANLAFWRREPILQAEFAQLGIVYSRYVDDITISSMLPIGNENLTTHIAKIYGILGGLGYRAKRSKHEIARANRPMTVTRIMTNVRPALPKAARHATRAVVFQLEKEAASATHRPPDFAKRLNSAAGRVGRLGQMHVAEAKLLKQRLTKLRRTAQDLI